MPQIGVGIGDGFRAAEDDGGARLFAEGDHAQHVVLGHQVAVDAHERGAAPAHHFSEIAQGVEGAVVNLNGEAARFQVGGDVQQPQRWVGLHDFLFVRVFGDEVTVR